MKQMQERNLMVASRDNDRCSCIMCFRRSWKSRKMQGIGLITAVAIIIVIAAYYSLRKPKLDLPGLDFRVDDKILSVTKTKGANNVLLKGHVALNFNLHSSWSSCEVETHSQGSEGVCARWENLVELSMTHSRIQSVDCYQISWQSLTRDYVPMDCYDIEDAHWYGGAQIRRQRWPVEKQPMKIQQYLSNDIGMVLDGYGSVLERYWLSSRGVAIFVEDDVPLHFGITASSLCFKADYDNSLYPNPLGIWPKLNYSICVGENIKEVHRFMANRHWSKPVDIPHTDLFKYPIWSTWAKYKKNITQEKVLEFFNDIKNNKFPVCQIEIDDMYTPVYGDFVFDPEKFPDPKSMAETIHDAGVKLSSWIIPFSNLDSEAFHEGAKKGYFIMDGTGKIPGLIKWWEGFAGITDFTNPEAAEWFFRRLQNLKDSGIDTFKFDAGEINFLPPNFHTHKPLINPNHYSIFYARNALKHTDKRLEIRVGYKTQDLPVFVRMMDINSDWTWEKGFLTMIPTALHFGLIGYPFILPDMIGGNAYFNTTTPTGQPRLPEKELYIRWVQLNTFLSTMQFSIGPWQYDEETIQIVRKMLKLHEEYVTPIMLRLARDSTKTGDPIIRPLWWLDPYDKEALEMETQFLVGDDLLVAPVLENGGRSRDVYLPKGEWEDMLRGGTITGRKHLKDYKVALDEIAYFRRKSSS